MWVLLHHACPLLVICKLACKRVICWSSNPLRNLGAVKPFETHKGSRIYFTSSWASSTWPEKKQKTVACQRAAVEKGRSREALQAGRRPQSGRCDHPEISPSRFIRKSPSKIWLQCGSEHVLRTSWDNVVIIKNSWAKRHEARIPEPWSFRASVSVFLLMHTQGGVYLYIVQVLTNPGMHECKVSRRVWVPHEAGNGNAKLFIWGVSQADGGWRVSGHLPCTASCTAPIGYRSGAFMAQRRENFSTSKRIKKDEEVTCEDEQFESRLLSQIIEIQGILGFLHSFLLREAAHRHA